MPLIPYDSSSCAQVADPWVGFPICSICLLTLAGIRRANDAIAGLRMELIQSVMICTRCQAEHKGMCGNDPHEPENNPTYWMDLIEVLRVSSHDNVVEDDYEWHMAVAMSKSYGSG